MEQVLKIEEIEKQFDSEWVLLGNPQTDECLQVLSGEVLYHSKDRAEFDREMLKIRPRPARIAVLYIGEPAAGMEYVL